MKIAIKHRLVFFWFLIKEWFKKIQQTGQLGPCEDKSTIVLTLSENVMVEKTQKQKKSLFVEQKDDVTINDVLVEDPKEAVDVVVEQPIPQPITNAKSDVTVDQEPDVKYDEPVVKSIEPLVRFHQHYAVSKEFNKESSWTAPYLNENVSSLHQMIDSRFPHLHAIMSLDSTYTGKLHLKASRVMHNGLFDSRDCELLIDDLLNALSEELFIKSEQVNKLPSICKESGPRLTILRKQNSNKFENVHAITKKWSYYVNNDEIVLLFDDDNNSNVEIHCVCSQPIVLHYTGCLFNFIQEIYNPMTPKIVYGSYFEITPPNSTWRIHR